MFDNGYVYLFAADGPCFGCYKIGIATDVEKRVRQFSKLPFGVSVLHFVKCVDVNNTEAKLLRYFSKYCINGEWFKLSPEQVRMITSCNSEQEINEMTGEMESSRYPLRMPADLYEEIQRLAEKNFHSINAEMVRLLRKAIESEKPGDDTPPTVTIR